MTKQLQFGLVAEGDSRHSAILRLPHIADDLGPVKSSSFGTARKLSNFLRAGYAVTDYDELQAARVILLRVSDETLPRIMDEMYAAGLALSNYSFVLCESWLTTEALAPLRQAGATVATIVSVPTPERNWFLMEGQQAAIRPLRQFIDRNEARALEIRTGTKYLYFAAELLATALPMPLLLASQQALRGTGLTSHNLNTISGEMIQEMVRGFLKGARMTWGGPLKECSPELAASHLTALRSSHPEIAETIDQHLPYAQEVMAKYRAETGGEG
jgi:predicted short-subunit dehydrogenase-like oxidoreductase (DUF2520 family)